MHAPQKVFTKLPSNTRSIFPWCKNNNFLNCFHEPSVGATARCVSIPINWRNWARNARDRISPCISTGSGMSVRGVVGPWSGNTAALSLGVPINRSIDAGAAPDNGWRVGRSTSWKPVGADSVTLAGMMDGADVTCAGQAKARIRPLCSSCSWQHRRSAMKVPLSAGTRRPQDLAWL